MQVAFEGEIIHTQYCIEDKRLDTYLHKYKVGIEIDEYDHEDRDPEYGRSRQLIIEGHGITVIIIDADAVDFNINNLINTVFVHIKKSTKKSLIDDLLKRLLGLEFKSNNSIRTKCVKWIV